MPTTGPISLSEVDNCSRYALGYFDYTLGPGVFGAGYEIAFVPGPSILLRIHVYPSSPFTSFATSDVLLTARPNDNAPSFQLAHFDPSSASLSGFATALDAQHDKEFNVSDVAADNGPHTAYTPAGVHIDAQYFTGVDTPTQGTCYVLFEYLPLTAAL